MNFSIISKQQQQYSWFYQFMVESCNVDILCIVAHTLLTIRLIAFTWNSSKYYPIKQNSPILTIACAVSFLFCNIFTFISRINVNQDFVIKQNSQYQTARCCFLSNKQVYIMSYLNQFFSQLPTMAYFLKMLRVLTAYNKRLYSIQIFVKIMKSQTILLIICLLYSSFMTGMDLNSRLSPSAYEKQAIDQSQSNQIFQFFCNIPNRTFDINYLIKHVVISIIFCIFYHLSYKLSPKLRFSHQWFSYLLISMMRVVTQDILQFYNISPTRPKYYLILLSNLGLTITNAIYLGSIDIQASQIPTNVDFLSNFKVVMLQQNARYSLQCFFKQKNVSCFYNAYRKVMKINYIKFDKNKLFKLIIQKDLKQFVETPRGSAMFPKTLLQSIRNKKYSTISAQYKMFKDNLQILCNQVYVQWKQTKGYQNWTQLVYKNKQYIQPLCNLKIDI